MLFLLLFVLALVAMVGLAFNGFKNGDIKKLTAPIDGDLEFCGLSGTKTEGYGKLYMANLEEKDLKRIFNYAVCVKECPTQADQIECVPTKMVPDCSSVVV